MSEEIVLREALKGVWETVHAISNIVWNAKSEPILKIKQLAEKAESELEAALASQPPHASSRPAEYCKICGCVLSKDHHCGEQTLEDA